MKPYKSFFKRAIDIAASGGALLVLAVPLTAVTLWLHFANKGAGAFFTQERPGKNGKIFKVVKFKTMTDERDANGKLLPDADRLTKVGRFVRSTSIDELPQLWNVLKGEMSIVGPRPPLPREVAQYTDWDWGRLAVKPGLTCYWQVSGRSDVGFEDWMRLDLKYVEEQGFLTDMKILFKTVGVVLRGDGAY